MLIWGIGGGVGDRRLRDRRALGARTIVTSGSEWKLEQARDWGADVAVNHADGDVVAAVKEATGQGRPRRRRDRRRGDLGTLAGGRQAGRPGHGVRRDERPQPAGGAAPLLVEAAHRLRLDDGDARGLPRRLRPRPLRPRARARRPVFPLAETRAAHERLEAGEQLGKIVLAIPG